MTLCLHSGLAGGLFLGFGTPDVASSFCVSGEVGGGLSRL